MAHIKKIPDTEKSSKRKKGFISKVSSTKAMKLQDAGLEQPEEKLVDDSKEVEQPMALDVPMDGIPKENAEGSIISSDGESLAGDEPNDTGDAHELNDSNMSDSNESSKEDGEKKKVPPFVELYKNGYCVKNNGKEQYYAKDDLGNEYYAITSSNTPYYACKTIQVGDSEEKVEFPATNKDGFIQYLFDRGVPKYPENLTTNHIMWPINPETKEQMYLKYSNGLISYPENKYGKQFYRKDLKGNEVPINNYVYAELGDGNQYYPKYANGDEFYLRDPDARNIERIAMKRDGDKLVPFYARKTNGDEIYPREYVEDEYGNRYGFH